MMAVNRPWEPRPGVLKVRSAGSIWISRKIVAAIVALTRASWPRRVPRSYAMARHTTRPSTPKVAVTGICSSGSQGAIRLLPAGQRQVRDDHEEAADDRQRHHRHHAGANGRHVGVVAQRGQRRHHMAVQQRGQPRHGASACPWRAARACPMRVHLLEGHGDVVHVGLRARASSTGRARCPARCRSAGCSDTGPACSPGDARALREVRTEGLVPEQRLVRQRVPVTGSCTECPRPGAPRGPPNAGRRRSPRRAAA